MLVRMFLCLLGLNLIALPLQSEITPEKQEEVFITIFQPTQESFMGTLLDARVRKINYRLGESFSEGDVLLEFEDDPYLAAYERAKVLVMKAKIDLDAKASLYKDTLVSNTDYLTAQVDYATALSELAISKYRLEQTKITAPFTGTVAFTLVNPGDAVIIGAPLLKIFDSRSLYAVFLVPSNMSVDIGQTVYIRLDNTGEIIESKIKRVGNYIDPSSSTFRVEALIDNEKGLLKPGLSGEASFNRDALIHFNTTTTINDREKQ